MFLFPGLSLKDQEWLPKFTKNAIMKEADDLTWCPKRSALLKRLDHALRKATNYRSNHDALAPGPAPHHLVAVLLV